MASPSTSAAPIPPVDTAIGVKPPSPPPPPKAKALVGHTSAVQTVAFFPSGRQLVSGSSDQTVRIWDIETGEQIGPALEGHEGIVQAVAVSRDGRVASGGFDNTLRVWDTRGESKDDGEVQDATGKLTSGRKQEWTLTKTFQTPDWVLSIDFSVDGKRVAAGMYNWTVQVWNTDDELLPFDAVRCSSAVRSVRYSLNSRRLAAAAHDIYIWDSETGDPVRVIRGGTEDWSTLQWFPDSNQIVAGGHGIVSVYDAANGECLRSWKPYPQAQAVYPQINSLSLSSNGRLVSIQPTVDASRTIVVSNASTGERVASFKHDQHVKYAVFSPTSKLIATASEDHDIYLWRVPRSSSTEDTESEESMTHAEAEAEPSELSFLDLPATFPLGRSSQRQQVDEIGMDVLGSILRTAGPEDVAAEAGIVQEDPPPKKRFAFTRWRGFVANKLRSLPRTSVAGGPDNRSHQPRITLVSYTKLRSVFAVARKTPPRAQPIYELPDDDEQVEQGPPTADVSTAGQDTVANAGAPAAATQSQGQDQQPRVEQGGTSLVLSGTMKPATQSIDSDDSWEVDCCWCCPRWCVCLHR